MLILPVQIHLNYFNLSILTHQLGFLMLLGDLSLGYMTMLCTFTTKFSIQAEISCHNAAVQVDFPLLFHYFNSNSLPYKAFATICESV